MNIIFSILFWMLTTALVIWNLNITVNATAKYSYKSALNEKVRLMGGTMKYFLKKLLGHERSMVHWKKNCKTLSPPPYILNVRSLIWICCFCMTLMYSSIINKSQDSIKRCTCASPLLTSFYLLDSVLDCAEKRFFLNSWILW